MESELLDFLELKLNGRVSVERVVSGSGLPNVSSSDSGRSGIPF
jgi:glucokinase